MLTPKWQKSEHDFFFSFYFEQEEKKNRKKASRDKNEGECKFD